MRYKYCLFDMDGTLSDPGIGITNSVMYALEKFDIHETEREKLYTFIGPPLTESFPKYYGFNSEQCDKAIVYFREYFKDKGIFENVLYESIPSLLEELKKRGYVIALATSKRVDFAIRILEHFELKQYFDHIGAASMDGKISKKADVITALLKDMGDCDRDRIVMIGDRSHDIIGAKENGLKSIGVLWGYGSEEELSSAGADYLAKQPEDILTIV